MYNILVVDDEPRVCEGIKNFLLGSELRITRVETAVNGFEAIDYLRMDTYDLVLTDIQMSRMTGLELMETIYMEQPHLPVIVISAHEKFDFAKKSLSLGARDYLVKPVEREDLLRVVGKVLNEKEERGRKSLELSRQQREREVGDDGRAGRSELLMELVTEGTLSKQDRQGLAASLAGEGNGLFAVLAIRLDLAGGGFSRREVKLQDRKLLKYASINIVEESLAEWQGLTFNSYGNELVAIVRIGEEESSESAEAGAGTRAGTGADAGAGAGEGAEAPDAADAARTRLRSRLHLIGRTVCMNLKQFLNVESTIGISTPHADVFMLPRLMDEANGAAEWRHLHPGQSVFDYEDRKARENSRISKWMVRVQSFIDEMKASREDTDSEQRGEGNPIYGELEEMADSAELFNSCFGMLVYRLYGLLLEHGPAGGLSMQRFDPAVYFRREAPDARLVQLRAYVQEASELLRTLVLERDRSIVARIADYIRGHYRNPALKIQDIAGNVHFSPAYVSYLFKKETGQNVWDYVTELRIEDARLLLHTTDKKRYEIAYEVGYESPEHFSRMFKRCVGVSPADYRRDGRGNSR